MCGEKSETVPALGNSSRRKKLVDKPLKKFRKYCDAQKRWQQKHDETFIEYLRYKKSTYLS
jgi:predicted ATP-grasp superfamily ATP-dependent carboligase